MKETIVPHRASRAAAFAALAAIALLVGGCVANPYDGVWQPENGAGAPVNPATGTQEPDTTNR